MTGNIQNFCPTWSFEKGSRCGERWPCSKLSHALTNFLLHRVAGFLEQIFPDLGGDDFDLWLVEGKEFFAFDVKLVAVCSCDMDDTGYRPVALIDSLAN